MLCLEADCASLGECCTVCAGKAAVPVRCVYLNARLGCVDLHCAAAYRLCYLCCKTQFANLLFVEDIAVVVTCAMLDLLLVGIDACTNRSWGGEVECSTLYRCYAAVRYRCVIDWYKEIGVDFADEIVNCSCWVRNT